ncbi:MAG: hypothetical protein ACRDYZ_01785 [Acidimicrobiales bacterium]
MTRTLHRHRLAVVAGLVAVALGAAACSPGTGTTPTASRQPSHPASTAPTKSLTAKASPTTTTLPPVTTAPATTAPATTLPPATTAPATTLPPVTTTTGAAAPTQSPAAAVGPITSPPLPAPGPGFVPGHVTAEGDSVMIDYQGLLEQDVPGIAVTASVSRGWTAGAAALRQLKAAGQLGAVVVVGLSTNGPVTSTQFDSMMTVLSGASRVVFVNTRVDRTWQTPNNSVLATGVAAHPRAVLADWHSLAVANAGWLYATQTHLPVDGTGAAALAALVAGKV